MKVFISILSEIIAAIGALALLMGLLWVGQGTGIVRWPASSFMISQIAWAFYGAALAAIGIGLIAVSRLAVRAAGAVGYSIGNIFLGLAISFCLLAFVNEVEFLGARCFYIGELTTAKCAPPWLYYAVWFIAIALMSFGALQMIRNRFGISRNDG